MQPKNKSRSLFLYYSWCPHSFKIFVRDMDLQKKLESRGRGLKGLKYIKTFSALKSKGARVEFDACDFFFKYLVDLIFMQGDVI